MTNENCPDGAPITSPFDFTDMDYVGFKDGRMVAIAYVWKPTPQGKRENARTLRDFALAGYEVQTMPHKEACEIFKRDNFPEAPP